jgi:hypothetical protein
VDDSATIAKAVVDCGWRQGDILPLAAHADITAAIGRDLEPAQACIVITHSCDLARPDPTLDAEIVIATPTQKKLDGSVAYARSRKRLQIELAVAGIRQAVEIHANDRFDLPLAVLQHGPDKSRTLIDDQREILIEWLIARYARPGFPDAFEKSIAK